jgi:nitrogen fixation/metabolism regulation signal transduction histidine kinase
VEGKAMKITIIGAVLILIAIFAAVWLAVYLKSRAVDPNIEKT